MRKTMAVLGLGLLAFGPGGPVQAEDPASPSPYGATYTTDELAALDRALHAGNLTRDDLTFRKDMAKGTHCLPLVKALLHDPLLIAPKLDELVASLPASALANPDNPDDPDPPVRQAEPFLAVVAACNLLRERAVGFPLPEVSRQTGFAFLRPPALGQARPTTPEAAVHELAKLAAIPVALFLAEGRETPQPEDVRAQVLRAKLPDDMLMREVFRSPHDASVDAAVAAYLKERAPDHLLALAAGLHHPEPERLPASLYAFAHALEIASWTLPAEAFPTDAPRILDTPHGRVALGTPKDDVYEGDFAVLLDPGGDDVYRNGRFGAAFGTAGRRVGILLDLGGNDLYDCREVDCTLGAAILGVGMLIDRGQGNDRYRAGHLSLGAAVGGMALLHDDGGSDVYEGKTFTQGAAAFGVGVLFDQSMQDAPKVSTSEETKDPVAIAAWDNDRLTAWCTAQGFSRTLGVGLCINQRGNDVYEAGGVYLHAPLFADRYQSFSQGFSIGAREHDMAGGVAALIDLDGNDRYLGDIYNQGVGYWYAAGLLYDGGGNDLYEMTQYGQGSGIHLAVGGLVDVSGSDAYVMHSGLGQGGSHDFAASVLHDRGGNDRYHGNTSCCGTGLTNSVGLFLDRSGDDIYSARRDGGLNAGRPARGFGSVGVFLDLGGKDDHLGTLADDTLRRDSDLGLGLDLPSPAAVPGGATPASPREGDGTKVEVPAVVDTKGPLTEAVFDELWALAVRWEVGENRFIVPLARKRLIAFGPDVLPLLDAKMEKDESGLELRAYVDVLGGLLPDAKPAVHALLARNAGHEVERRRRVALHLIGELKVVELEEAVVKLLEGDDDALARRAAGVLLLLQSRAGEERLMSWLAAPDPDERRVLAALGTLLGTGADVYPQVRGLLGHRLVTVRTRLATLLAERRERYGAALLGDLGAADLSDRARRTLLDAVARGPVAPTPEAAAAVIALLGHADWGMRGDAARVARLWLDKPPADAGAERQALAGALEGLLAGEADVFVRRMAEGR
jgi:hypothetical protein